MARRKLYAECRLLGAFGAEDVDRPVERIGLHDLAHQSRQAFSPLAEVDGPCRHHHPYRTCRSNRLAAFSAPMIAAAIAASAPGQTHTLEPSMSNSIECGRATAALFAASKLGDAEVFAVSTIAGTNGGASILASALRHASPAPGEQLLRRQAMTTRDMAGPNAFLEALGTIAAFSRALQLRRRPAPVKISTRRAGASPSDTCLRSEIDMCRSPLSPRLSPPRPPRKR